MKEAPSSSETATQEVEDTLQPVPEHARTTKLSGQFWIWAGANVAPINWILGALGVQLGLGLADTMIVLVVGNLIGMAGFGFFVLLGQKTGATGMLLARGAFGRRGAYLPAAIQALVAIGWAAVNTWIILDLVMALFGLIGWVDPSQQNLGWRLGVAAVIMTVQVIICYRGYKAIARFERWTMPPTLVVLVAMSLIAWTTLHIDWGYQGPPGAVLEGGARFATMSGIMTAIGIGWGIGWFTYAPDYSRFVSTSVKPARLFAASALGQFLPVVWLGLLGASLATKNGQADPGELIVSNFGVMAIPVILLVIHGPIATNIINMYTFSVAVQALDVKISRKVLSIVVGVLAMVGVYLFTLAPDFGQTLDSWLSAIVAWVATWGGIMAVHYYVFERKHRDFSYLFLAPTDTHLKAFNPIAFISFIAGMIATWLFMYGAIPAFQGPIATAMGGVDLSWLAGTVVAGGLYLVLGWPRFKSRIHEGVPLGIRQDLTDREVLDTRGNAVIPRPDQVPVAAGSVEGATPDAEGSGNAPVHA
ncbi:cytosine permease [Tersicoccus sp. MR15.9]|uniref:purine-cytosine permease family protein n=1 Tax=Tersicoccus mangrovi TaxID=3121635 RepID=UPI002FE68432